MIIVAYSFTEILLSMLLFELSELKQRKQFEAAAICGRLKFALNRIE